MPGGFTWIRRVVARGWHRRCPHCGRGRLFAEWGRHLDRCQSCGLVYERNPGDTWFFTIIGDRLPIAVMVAVIYFGVFRTRPVLGTALFVALMSVVIWTSPNRWGVGIALHYLSRVYMPDADDPLPPDPDDRLH